MYICNFNDDSNGDDIEIPSNVVQFLNEATFTPSLNTAISDDSLSGKMFFRHISTTDSDFPITTCTYYAGEGWFGSAITNNPTLTEGDEIQFENLSSEDITFQHPVTGPYTLPPGVTIEIILTLPESDTQIYPGPICMCCEEGTNENCYFGCCPCKEGFATIMSWETVGYYCEMPNICCEDSSPNNGVCDNHPSFWILSCDPCVTIDCLEPPCDGFWQNAEPEYNWDSATCEELGQITCEDGECADTIQDCPEYVDPSIGSILGHISVREESDGQCKGPYINCSFDSTYDWAQGDVDTPEECCALVYGLNAGENNFPYADWWDNSSNPDDYIAEHCLTDGSRVYYICYEKLPYQLGDVNLDFNINIQDVIILVDYILGFVDNLTEQQLALADLNQDGIININDVLMLINSILNDNRVSTNDREELHRQRDRLQPNEQEKQSEKEKLINRILRIQNKNV